VDASDDVVVQWDQRNLVTQGFGSSVAQNRLQKYQGRGPDQRATATDEEVQADLTATFAKVSWHGMYPNSVSNGMEGYLFSPGTVL
jgi:hypothetical protein